MHVPDPLRPAVSAFEAAAALLGAMTGHLARRVAVGGRVSVDKLDEHQIDAYELAIALSRLQAARSIIGFAIAPSTRASPPPSSPRS